MPSGQVTDPEAIVNQKRNLEKYMQHPITVTLLRDVDEVRQNLFNSIFVEDNIPGQNNDERMNYVNLVKGNIRGISLFEALLRGEIADANALYEQIRESIKRENQVIPEVGKEDYNRGGYPPEEPI